jgi:hypothetical protein
VSAPTPEQIAGWQSSSGKDRTRQIALLSKIALELARKAHPNPIIFADVRIVAVQRGFLTGHEKGRELSFGGAVMRAAGLVRTGGYRRSHVEQSHGNLHAEYALPGEQRELAA